MTVSEYESCCELHFYWNFKCPLSLASLVNNNKICGGKDQSAGIIYTGCFYKLSTINLVWGPLKCTKSNFDIVHVFLHFKSFCLVVLQLILASKLSELEQFEKRAENCLFADKIEFFGKWLHPRAKLKKTDPT